MCRYVLLIPKLEMADEVDEYRVMLYQARHKLLTMTVKKKRKKEKKEKESLRILKIYTVCLQYYLCRFFTKRILFQ